MKTFNFKNIKLQNYCCYVDPLSWEFKPSTIMLITGPNGSGKSTIVNSLYYCLYGMTPDGLRGEDVVNNKTKKNCSAVLEFDFDNSNYKISRYVKHYKFGTTSFLYKDDKIIAKGSREVNNIINNMIPRKTLSNTMFFGSHIKDFFTDTTDANRKEIFRNLLSLEKWKEYYDITSDILNKKQSELTQVETIYQMLIDNCKNTEIKIRDEKIRIETNKQLQLSKIHDKEIEITQTKDDLEKAKNDLDIITNSLNKELVVLKDKELEINKINSSLELEIMKTKQKFSDQINNFENKKQTEIKNVNDIYSQMQTTKDEKLKEEEAKITKLKVERNKKLIELKEKRDEIEKLKSERDEKINSINKQIWTEEGNVKTSKTRIKELNNALQLDGVCPTCAREITEDSKRHLKKLIEDKNRSVQISLEQISKLKTNLTKINQEYDIDKKIFEINNEEEKVEKDYPIESLLTKIHQNYNQEIISLNKLRQNNISKIENKYEEKKHNLICQQDNELTQIKSHFNISNLNNDLIEIRQRVSNLEQEKRTNKNRVDEILMQLASCESELKSYKNFKPDESLLLNLENDLNEFNIKKLSVEVQKKNLEKDIKIYKFWKTGFSNTGIPSLLIDDSIPYMNQRIAYYLSLIGSSRYSVSFDTMSETKTSGFKDKISVNVIDNLTMANKQVQLSSGQKRLIDIATMFTLKDLYERVSNVSFNTIIFDEIFDALDTENSLVVSKAIEKIVQEKAIVIVIISHHEITTIDTNDVYQLK